MKLLKISNSGISASIDDEDFERLSKYSWFNNGTRIARTTTKNYKSVNVALAAEIMHKPQQMFDHIDRNFLNNQKANLRPATRAQNSYNRSKTKSKTSSKYKGVCWHKPAKKWLASIKFNGCSIHLGFFIKEEDAAKAYDDKAISLFREFAVLNNINTK